MYKAVLVICCLLFTSCGPYIITETYKDGAPYSGEVICTYYEVQRGDCLREASRFCGSRRVWLVKMGSVTVHRWSYNRDFRRWEDHEQTKSRLVFTCRDR